MRGRNLVGFKGFVALSFSGLISASAFAQPVLITASQSIAPGQATITPTGGGAPVPLATADITVSGGTTVLTVDGEHSIASLSLVSGATLTHTAGFTYDSDPGPDIALAGGFSITTTGDIIIDSGSFVVADNKGFAGSAGPAAGGSSNGIGVLYGGGGGHGGSGGHINSASFGGGTYGSFVAPNTLGSGGGANSIGTPGTSGGGTIVLHAGGAMNISGTMRCDGGATTASNSPGCGAGGSIWLTANTITGTGLIQANGGSQAGNAGDGGGGRISITANSSTLLATIRANSNGDGGGVGTIYQSINGVNTLIFDGNGAASRQSQNISVNGDVIFRSGANVGHQFGDTNGLTITATGDITVESTATIDLGGLGFAGSTGPAAGGSSNGISVLYGGGGGHGGSGGHINSASFGGGTYGAFAGPITLGSGGGANSVGTPGTSGGGAIKLVAGGSININGIIRSNGVNATPSNAPGCGAGGSIWLSAGGAFSGTGLVEANGGNQSGASGDGGGGRVAIIANSSTWNGTMRAFGGGNDGGGVGSVYQSFGGVNTLIFDGTSDTSRQSQPINVNGNIIVRNGGSIGHPFASESGLLVTATGNFTVESSGTIDLNALGYPGATGPAAGGSSNGISVLYGGGGGHGGSGGHINSASFGGGTYGAFAGPITLGSGGGANAAGTPGTTGGGAIKIVAGGDVLINGTIRSNGINSTPSNAPGCGAGGSIWISGSTFAGSGLIEANGGNQSGQSGDGGGGRVAVFANSSTYNGTMRALSGGNDGGGIGTVYQSFGGVNTLIFDGIGAASRQSNPIVVNGNIIVRNGGSIGHPFASETGLSVSATGNMTVESSGTIDLNALGYPGSAGPGAGASSNGISSLYGAGGGHGGVGGTTAAAIPGGGVYGSANAPTTLGSGGGANSAGTPGTAGGGAIKLDIGGTLTINGTIRSSGINSTPTNAPGCGAGGSIWITATTLAGTGLIEANGGVQSGNSGDGGGGRIAVYRCFNSFAGTIRALAGGGGPSAQNGTVINDTIAGNASAVASAFCTGEVATLSVEAGGVGTLTFQWRRNSVALTDGVLPSGAVVAGAQSPSLTITGITQTEQGSYDCVVTASCATATSNPLPVNVVGASPEPCDNIDFNNDCSAFDPQDINAFLSVFSEGPCIPETATCNDIDFNNDGSLFDPCDIISFLIVFGEGPCTLCGE